MLAWKLEKVFLLIFYFFGLQTSKKKEALSELCKYFTPLKSFLSYGLQGKKAKKHAYQQILHRSGWKDS